MHQQLDGLLDVGNDSVAVGPGAGTHVHAHLGHAHGSWHACQLQLAGKVLAGHVQHQLLHVTHVDGLQVQGLRDQAQPGEGAGSEGSSTVKRWRMGLVMDADRPTMRRLQSTPFSTRVPLPAPLLSVVHPNITSKADTAASSDVALMVQCR